MQRNLVGILACTLVAAACDSGPSIAIDDLAVSGVRINAAEFAATGEFALGLLATDPAGQAILDPEVEIEATITSIDQGQAADFGLEPGAVNAETPDATSTSAAILLDDSGSMSSTDPQRLRADAARVFWEAVLAADAANEVALLDFGAGTTGTFTVSRLLNDWTTAESELEAALAQVGAFGSTPLYESLEEVAEWVGTTSPSSTHRVILLLSDGQPNSTTNRTVALGAAQSRDITVHTVGLGPASDLDLSRSDAAVAAIREIAEQTGGVYSSATSAAALESIFEVLAQVTSQGQLVAAFQLNPIPASGTRVSGTVTVSSGGETRTATWSFLVP